MNYIVFILGVVSAIVVILVAAVVVILLKMKRIKKIERRIDNIVNEVERQIDDNVDRIDDDVEELRRLISTVQNEMTLYIESNIRDVLSQSKSYTDSRFDKTKT